MRTDNPEAMSDRNVARLIAFAAMHAYGNSLGVVPPKHEEYRERVDNPRVGDLVVETTNWMLDDPCARLGWLREHATVTHETWVEEYWVIERILGEHAGTTIRWTNADFITVPLGPWHVDEREYRFPHINLEKEA